MNPFQPRWFETLHLLPHEADRLRRRRYGIIDVARGQLVGIHLRPFPRWATAWDVIWSGPRRHARTTGDRMRVYFNQPWRHPRYLAITYAESTSDCRHATLVAALRLLDEVARIKGADALLCDAWNARITDRLLARYGWQPHLESRWHRHFIKRFYGTYPQHGGASSTAGLAPGRACEVECSSGAT